MVNVHTLIGALAKERPVFHSEADFQHAFAWIFHLTFPEAAIRLERPMKSKLGLLHVDVVVELRGQLHAVELKYKTRSVTTRVGSEQFMLQDHVAQPLGRYDFLKDVARMASLAEEMPDRAAYAILLTNDSAYWAKPRSIGDTSAAFSLSDGRVVSDRLDWSSRAAAGTKRMRERPIEFAADYPLNWRDYSRIECCSYPQFRYLAVEATAKVPGLSTAVTRD